MLTQGATSDRPVDGSILASERAIAINPQKDFAAKWQGDPLSNRPLSLRDRPQKIAPISRSEGEAEAIFADSAVMF
ncbi:hypothetical protein [Laspinema olomoucense]|uniref:Uncharacterized protein n=1 Tax=Laspinema olomoucense D3b TaxID=2953688 RepID=A0ABT2N4H7_9CYAN|nr:MULTISPECIES: hypothetical protein [unclassified Laspinema]MCT7976680.1 hypothetical protein [Laspinema sp. D3b]MCT7991757.1 hypothetical protein [Laspinema sp. D3a]MCT7995623.1 hypothetical protein [Laspinema sp. D3c]